MGFDDGKSKYWRIGPQKDFILVSMAIDSWQKYYILMFFVAIIKPGVSLCNAFALILAAKYE